MAYINSEDFLLAIQDVNLQQIISSNTAILDQAVLVAIGEARSYLVQKYDYDAELSKTGDTRNPQLVNYIIDLAIYHLHTRISPRNIPVLRQTRYDNAIAWLKMCAFGDIMPNLDRTPEDLGNRVRMGYNTKNQNSY